MSWKRWLASFLVISSVLTAAEELDEEIPDYSFWDCHPVHIGGQAIALGEATVKRRGGGGDDGHVYFRRASAFTSLLLPISKEHIFSPRLDWTWVNLDWNNNPAFNTTNFYYYRFALSYYTTAVEKWRWITRADYTVDQKHFSGSYGLFSGMIWGTYQLFHDWHYHIGGLAYVGLNTTTYYPIIGFDYAPTEHWSMQFVFPMLYSVEYHFNCNWSLALKGRPVKERIRVGGNEPQPKSIFSYSTFGGEINLKYEKFLRGDIELFVGYNFGGPFYIKQPQALYTDVQGAPYVGLSLDYGF